MAPILLATDQLGASPLQSPCLSTGSLAGSFQGCRHPPPKTSSPVSGTPPPKNRVRWGDELFRFSFVWLVDLHPLSRSQEENSGSWKSGSAGSPPSGGRQEAGLDRPDVLGKEIREAGSLRPVRIFWSLRERSPGFLQRALSQGLSSFMGFPPDLTGKGESDLQSTPKSKYPKIT